MNETKNQAVGVILRTKTWRGCEEAGFSQIQSAEGNFDLGSATKQNNSEHTKVRGGRYHGILETSLVCGELNVWL